MTRSIVAARCRGRFPTFLPPHHDAALIAAESQFTMRDITRARTVAILASTALLAATPALADEGKEPHLDLWISTAGGTLVTGGWDHLTGEVVAPSLRVFEAEFGIDPLFPFATDEPGIGSDLVGTTLTMNLLAGLGRWNGAGFDATDAVLAASYGGQGASTVAGGAFSFLVGEGLDLHPEYTLAGAGGDPSDGIYLASFTVSAAQYGTSETFWVVFNLNLDEEAHEAATAWVEANLVPAPGAFALLALAAARGRRRH